MRRTFTRRKKTEMIDLDITSLLDILVIMLVFLLLNYNASDLKLELASGVEMAPSESQRITHFAPVVQLNSKDSIFIDDKEIANMGTQGEAQALSILAEKLKERHGTLSDKEKKAEEGALINLVFDKQTDYAKVEKVMETSAKVGFTQFKFIVEANY